MTIGPHLLGRIVNHDPALEVVHRVAANRQPRNTSWENDAAILDRATSDPASATRARWLNCKVASFSRARGSLPGAPRGTLRHLHGVRDPTTTSSTHRPRCNARAPGRRLASRNNAVR